MDDEEFEYFDDEDFFAIDFRTVIKDLAEDIDFEKKLIKNSHRFEDKLSAAEVVIDQFVIDNLEKSPDLMRVIRNIGNEIRKLLKTLKKWDHGEINIVLELEAAQKKGKEWILKHKKQVEGEIVEEKKLEKKVLRLVKQFFKDLRKEFEKSKHLFDVSLENARVAKFKAKIQADEEDFKLVIEGLLQFTMAYEHIFKTH
jgi:hypothetical protein